MSFHERLKEVRESRGLTQAELARLSGLIQSHLCHFESGSRKPSFDTLRSLSIALGVSADFLLETTKKVSDDSILAGLTARERRLVKGIVRAIIANRRQLSEKRGIER